MSSYKQKKISTIVKEISIVSGQSKYDIAGIDLGKSKFFYRVSQEQFQDLNVGDYTLDKSNNTQTIEITNSEILQKAEAIQICYVVDLTSSKYEFDFDVDINRLTTSYNQLVDDVHVLWEYVKKTGMIADDTTIDLILPQLNTDEVWVKTEDGYKGVSLTDAEGEIKKVIEEYTKLMEDRLDAYVENPLKPRLDSYVEDVEKPKLDNHVENVNKAELNDYTSKLEEKLQSMIDNAVSDKGLIPRGSDWFNIALGNWYVTDLFNMGYTNYPPKLKQEDNSGVVKKDITDNGRSQILRFWTTTGKLLFAVRVNEVWSEWQEIGENTDSIQFTQANHGFVFTPVTLDGTTRRWVKANKYTGADGIAIKVDNDRFNVVSKGFIEIPPQAKDDKGNDFIYDEYYFLSQTIDGGFSREKNLTGLFQNLIHISETNGRLSAYIDVQDPINLDYQVLDSDRAERIGLATIDTVLRKVDNISLLKRLNLKVGDIVEVLGYYTKDDGATHKRTISSTDDGSGEQLDNGLWANILHNGEVNVDWFGAKGDNTTDDSDIIQKVINLNTINKINLSAKKYHLSKGLSLRDSLVIEGISTGNLVNKTNLAFQMGSGIAISAGTGTQGVVGGSNRYNHKCTLRNITLINKGEQKSISGVIVYSESTTLDGIVMENFDTGILLNGWYNELTRCKTRFCNHGTVIEGNAMLIQGNFSQDNVEENYSFFGQGLTVVDNDFASYETYNTKIGMKFKSVFGCTFSSNYFEGYVQTMFKANEVNSTSISNLYMSAVEIKDNTKKMKIFDLNTFHFSSISNIFGVPRYDVEMGTIERCYRSKFSNINCGRANKGFTLSDINSIFENIIMENSEIEYSFSAKAYSDYTRCTFIGLANNVLEKMVNMDYASNYSKFLKITDRPNVGVDETTLKYSLQGDVVINKAAYPNIVYKVNTKVPAGQQWLGVTLLDKYARLDTPYWKGILEQADAWQDLVTYLNALRKSPSATPSEKLKQFCIDNNII